MSSKKFYIDIDLNGNETVNLKADTVLSLPLASSNAKRIVYYNNFYYYSNGTDWIKLSNTSSNGIPVGGTAGQLLAKVNGTDYNTEWIDNFTSTIKHLVKIDQAGGINKGQAVYVNDANGTNILVKKASNKAEATSSKTMGLLETSGAFNNSVYVITEGLLNGIGSAPLNTSAATIGDPVWLGVNGNLIYGLIDKPTAPDHLVFLGIVTRVHPVVGEIFVKVQNGFELKELHDVVAETPNDNDVLYYDASTLLWRTDTVNSLLSYTPVNLAGDTMTGFLTLSADPTLNYHAVTKQYVDNIVSGINFHEATYAATTTNLSANYNNGTSGVGATLTAVANGELIIDGINFSTLTPVSPYRILVKNQTNQTENGIYVVTNRGSTLTKYILTRAIDADNSPAGELAYGDFSLNLNGTQNGGYGYIMTTSGVITIGVSNITYTIYNVAQAVSAGAGLQELSPNVLSVDTSTILSVAGAALTYIPYTGANNNVDLGAFQLTTNQLNIDTKGNISSSGTNTLLVNNTATDGTTKVQFNGVDSLILKGATTSNAASLTYTKPTRTGLTGENVKSIQITTGTSEWTNWANFPGILQKEIEITSPYYTVTALLPPPSGPSGDFYTLYINAPTVNTWGVYGNALGLYGSFQMKGDATDYPGGTILDIGSDGDGTIIGFTGAKLSFFGNPPIVQPSAVTTVQGLSDALSNLGLIAVSTPSIWNVTTQSGATYSAITNDYVLVNASSQVITLPAPSLGRRVGVKVITTVTNIQVRTNAVGVTIDGTDRSSIGLGIYNQWDAYTFVSSATAWYIES
jgi:hypothetical protein